ncbi:MAG: PrsW family intramembrane metalloprotease [Anaerolineae bacterium]|nr:PrsW family intramembrane metalloprotease [Anaerolineae bacterium]
MQSRWPWLFVLAGGVVLLLASLGGSALFLLAGLLASEGMGLVEVLVIAGMIGMGLLFGIPLIWHGWAGWQGRPSGVFRPVLTAWLWLAFLLLLVAGTLLDHLSFYPTLLLPPIHVLTMTLPSLLVLWAVGGRLRGAVASWRETCTTMFGGGALALGTSLLGEGVIGLLALMSVMVVVMMIPGGQEMITALSERLQDPSQITEFADLAPLVLSPPIALVLLGVFSIPVPLVEEAFKTLAPGIAGKWLRPHPARAFWLGVAAGAGFALGENLFNGALGGTEGWTAGVLARCGATVMHCATGGLVGWGWGQLWRSGRPLRLLGTYLAAAVIHGIWNALSVGAVVLGAVGITSESGWPVYAAGVGTWLILGLLAMLCLLFAIGLLSVAGRLSAEQVTVTFESDRHLVA